MVAAVVVAVVVAVVAVVAAAVVAALVAVEEQVEDKRAVVVITTARAQDRYQYQCLQPQVLLVLPAAVVVLFPSRAVPLQGQLSGIITGLWSSLPV